MTETQLIDRFVHAWAKAENFFDNRKIPTVSQRLHNPCNLSNWHDANREPYPQVCGLVQFPDDETGFRAAKQQARINIMKRKLTFMEFFGGAILKDRWGNKLVIDGRVQVYRGACPRDEMRRFDPGSYARQVARALTGSPSVHVVIASLVIPTVSKARVGGLVR